MTVVLQNVYQFISMEALLTDKRIFTAERIMSYNLGTKTPDTTRSVKVSLNMKTMPTESVTFLYILSGFANQLSCLVIFSLPFFENHNLLFNRVKVLLMCTITGFTIFHLSSHLVYFVLYTSFNVCPGLLFLYASRFVCFMTIHLNPKIPHFHVIYDKVDKDLQIKCINLTFVLSITSASRKAQKDLSIFSENLQFDHTCMSQNQYVVIVANDLVILLQSA